MPNSLGSHDYVQTLKGQKLIFPNFDILFEDWPKGMSPHYGALQQVHDGELCKLLGPGPRLDALLSCNCAYNASTWWPTSSFDALRFASSFVAFLYIWDNEMDSPEFTDLVHDKIGSATFIEETVETIRRYLDDNHPSSSIRPEGLHLALASFSPIGEGGAFRLDRGQRLLFLHELIRYVRAVGEEQKAESRGMAPTIEEYLSLRQGTSAAQAMAALIEYMTDVNLGDELRKDSDIMTIYTETNTVISIMNDMFSLKRELQFPFYCNAIAVLYHQYQDLQAAVDKTYDIVTCSVKNLEKAAGKLLSRFPDRQNDLTTFINGAKTMITGNISWSVHNKRYNLNVSALDGKSEITI